MITINLLPKHLRPVKRTPIPHILSILVLLAAIAGMVVVFGAVSQPGVVTFPPETFAMDILDVIAKCGGFTANARRTSVRVKRRSAEGADQMLSVNVRNMLSGKESSPFFVQPGDVVTVDD